jgi:acetyl esterase
MTTAKERALAVGNRLGVKVIPRLPNSAKRLLSGGRALTIDGNTLDPSLQMLLAAQRAVGIEGLVVDGDPVKTRISNTVLTRTLDDPSVRVAEIRSVSIPGPAGVIAARHYRPPGGSAAGVLPRRRLGVR